MSCTVTLLPERKRTRSTLVERSTLESMEDGTETAESLNRPSATASHAWDCGCGSHMRLTHDSQPSLRIPKVIHLPAIHTLIGRADSCHAVVDSKIAPLLISRRHACLVHVAKNVCPIHSRGGTSGLVPPSACPNNSSPSSGPSEAPQQPTFPDRSRAHKRAQSIFYDELVAPPDGETEEDVKEEYLEAEAACICLEGDDGEDGDEVVDRIPDTASRCGVCGGGWVIADGDCRGSKSTNGILVNGVRVQQAAWLRTGDIITLGKCRKPPEFKYEFEVNEDPCNVTCTLGGSKRRRVSGCVETDEDKENVTSLQPPINSQERLTAALSDIGTPKLGIASEGQFFPLDLKDERVAEKLMETRSFAAFFEAKLGEAQVKRIQDSPTNRIKPRLAANQSGSNSAVTMDVDRLSTSREHGQNYDKGSIPSPFSTSSSSPISQKEVDPATSTGAISAESIQQELLCCICQDWLVHSSALDCGHVFCWQCIDSWLVTKRFFCPICRKAVTQEPIRMIQIDSLVQQAAAACPGAGEYAKRERLELIPILQDDSQG
eukprot:GHVN01024115.1.p1 GENE.GHVN01024115.1~~GHVN01024115.1.p1  ORF type:complete len:547 (-),score=39.41 GHVN01024115.1:630-2270(-)